MRVFYKSGVIALVLLLLCLPIVLAEIEIGGGSVTVGDSPSSSSGTGTSGSSGTGTSGSSGIEVGGGSVEVTDVNFGDFWNKIKEGTTNLVSKIPGLGGLASGTGTTAASSKEELRAAARAEFDNSFRLAREAALREFLNSRVGNVQNANLLNAVYGKEDADKNMPYNAVLTTIVNKYKYTAFSREQVDKLDSWFGEVKGSNIYDMLHSANAKGMISTEKYGEDKSTYGKAITDFVNKYRKAFTSAEITEIVNKKLTGTVIRQKLNAPADTEVAMTEAQLDSKLIDAALKEYDQAWNNIAYDPKPSNKLEEELKDFVEKYKGAFTDAQYKDITGFTDYGINSWTNPRDYGREVNAFLLENKKSSGLWAKIKSFFSFGGEKSITERVADYALGGSGYDKAWGWLFGLIIGIIAFVIAYPLHSIFRRNFWLKVWGVGIANAIVNPIVCCIFYELFAWIGVFGVVLMSIFFLPVVFAVGFGSKIFFSILAGAWLVLFPFGLIRCAGLMNWLANKINIISNYRIGPLASRVIAVVILVLFALIIIFIIRSIIGSFVA